MINYAILAVITMAYISRVTCLCPQRCTCLEEKLSVDCKSSSLDVVPITLNPEIRELFLSHNQIKSISSSFSFYTNLAFLDLSANQITSLHRKHFTFQRNLQVLLLSHNRLERLSNESFIGLNSLQLLNLADNTLTELTYRVFTGLESLERLDLSRNQITVIHDEAFYGLNVLKTLNLRSNKLASVPSVPLYLVPSLIKLDLGVNSLTTLSDYGFASLARLIDLRLDLCSISTISPRYAHGLVSLRRLQLDGNSLANLTSDLFSDLPSLEELVIGANKFNHVTSDTFSSLGATLRSLDIRYARELTSLDPTALSGLTVLSRLTIEYCPKLTYLPSELLRDSRSSIKELRLRGNGITGLPYSLVPWPQLTVFDLRDNPLICNCSILWMWKYLRRSSLPAPPSLSTSSSLPSTLSVSHSEINVSEISRDLVCSGPEEVFVGRRLVSLSLDELTCVDSSSNHLIAASIALGLISLLTCALSALWCRSRLPLVLLRHKKFTNNLTAHEEFVYEKGRFIESQVMFPPSSPYHPSSSLIIIQSPVKMSPISQV